MVFGFLKPKIPFGWLDESNAEILWRGKSGFPDKAYLSEVSADLPIAGKAFWPKGEGLVWRPHYQLTAWADANVRAEIEDLLDGFVCEEKTFEVLLLRSMPLSEINVHFRLMTVGHPGWTGFRIAWRKIKDEEGGVVYACQE